MEKVKVGYPVANELLDSNALSKPDSFILKSIAASFAGASIPAAIFYFLMWFINYMTKLNNRSQI